MHWIATRECLERQDYFERLAAELGIFILTKWGLSALVNVEAGGEIGRSGFTAREMSSFLVCFGRTYLIKNFPRTQRLYDSSLPSITTVA